MRASEISKCTAFVGLLFSTCLLLAAPGANQPAFYRPGWIVEGTLKRFAEIGERWKAGDTNLPLFSIQFFGPWDVVAHTTVTREGQFSSGSFTERGAKGWGDGQLDSTNLPKLQTLINALPPSPSDPIPIRRRLLISGARSNSWYSFTYDRADVPFEVERICDMVRGIIVWLPPSTTNCTRITQITKGDATFLTNAPNASLVAAAGLGGYGPSIVSPNGKTLVIGDFQRIVASDLPTMKKLWAKTDPIPDRRSTWLWAGAVVDNGKSVAVALADRIERWDLNTGEFLSVLDTNSVPWQHLMRASRDGSVLAADLGGGRIKIYRAPWTNSPQELVEHQWTTFLEMSLDGRYVVLRSHGGMGARMVVCDLSKGTRQEMPFRGCYNRDAYSAAWSPNGKYLAVGATGQWPCVYDTTTLKPILLWRVPSDTQYWSGGPTVNLAWSNGGELLAECGDGILQAVKLPVSDGGLDWDFPVDH